MRDEELARDAADEMLLHITKLGPLIRPTSLARLFDMARQRIYELVEAGEFRAVSVGPRSMRVTRASVEDFLRRRAAGVPFSAGLLDGWKNRPRKGKAR